MQLHVFSLTVVLFTVPASAPLYSTGEFINSTALNISWIAPLIQDQNGVLLGYNVTYNSSQDDLQETFVGGTSVDLFGLEEFTKYTITIGAFTVNGTGPTTSIVVQTDSDGE